MIDYIKKDKTIIFSPNYNKILDVNLISKYNVIIFSDYELTNNLFVSYVNNNFENLNYYYSLFN